MTGRLIASGEHSFLDWRASLRWEASIPLYVILEHDKLMRGRLMSPRIFVAVPVPS
jgi:hypothetical protein